MQNEITQYIIELDRIHQAGNATEHSYRPALQRLLESVMPGLIVTNEPRRIECGAPDYIVTRNEIPMGYVEAKDIGVNLKKPTQANKSQFDRYKQSLDNIIFTDYLEFFRYEKEKGEIVESVCLAERKDGKIRLFKENVARFESLIVHFCDARPQTIASPDKLAEVMAVKARLMAEVIEKTLVNDRSKGPLAELMGAFQEVLIKDTTPKEFAGLYAQTIAYGMFAARPRSTNSGRFNREEAARLIPKTNPFLRKLFLDIAVYDFDDRLRWIVDDLAEVFSAADMHAVMTNFGKRTSQSDPMIHFYENFLSAYDPALRKSRGVWYTPQAVVNFIVRAVDEILQQEFQLPMGLADTTKVKTQRLYTTKAGMECSEMTEIEVHKVQILDPAVGTGAFLAETVNQIHEKFSGQKGMWPGYVEEHLIPRLNGFEVLMAPYVMAHIHLNWQLGQTGYEAADKQRFHIYLTNSLTALRSGSQKIIHQLFTPEANEADIIKYNTPVMVVMGNPPYSGESQNKGKEIMELMNDYKKEPDTDLPLRERNSKWINDDYCKFIRLGQKFVEKNGEGILAYINNHAFLDNPTFRGMRWNLMRHFDKIYIIDLHGNSKRKEICPDGSKDENVFDIQQGVSINIFVKTGQKAENTLAEVYHLDLYGKRKEKLKFLQQKGLQTVKWKKLKPSAPLYFFVAKNLSSQKKYEKGFSVQELFPVNSVGIVTARDSLTIHYSREKLIETVKEFIRLDTEAARDQLDLGKDTRDWSVVGAKEDLTPKPEFKRIVEMNYRPFDKRFTYYTGNSKGFHCMPRNNVMRHYLAGENIGLVFKRGFIENAPPAFISNNIIDFRLWSRPGMQGGDYIAPLYLYPNGNALSNTIRTPNLEAKIVEKIAKHLGLQFTEEKEKSKKTFAPIDLLDYIYAVLHSPTYREKYKEFLKIDFPRVPYPEEAKTFWKLVSLGEKLRRLHLMEEVKPQPNMANFLVSGTNEVEMLQYAGGKVYINETQYFGNVSLEAWTFYIGGYQPAQKWLKDRKGRTLSFDEIQHYQKIIHALNETKTLMSEVDEVIMEN